MRKAVVVKISELILGRELTFPIHDTKGVLLLAAGARFTADVKQKLIDRGIVSVVLDECDASHMTLSAKRAAEATTLARLDNQLNERLESLIRSGMMTVRNSGPPLLQRVIPHGRTAYDSEHRRELQSRHQFASSTVEELMTDAVKGHDLNGAGVNKIAGTCAEGLVADMGSALSVAFEQSQDASLERHSVSVALLGMAIGIELGLDFENVQTVGMAGLVQDLGMSRIPPEVRLADRPLSAVEFLEVQKHPIWTANILEKAMGLPKLVQLVAYQTHERPDGSGYPRGRELKSIHQFARILNVADAYTALTSERPHRPPLMPYAAMETLLRQARRWQVDPHVVRALLHVVSLFPIGSFVTLSDGSVAQVLRANGRNFTQPVVMRLQDGDGAAIPPSDDRALVDLALSDLKVVQALPTPGRNELGPKDASDPSASSMPEHESSSAVATVTAGR